MQLAIIQLVTLAAAVVGTGWIASRALEAKVDAIKTEVETIRDAVKAASTHGKARPLGLALAAVACLGIPAPTALGAPATDGGQETAVIDLTVRDVIVLALRNSRLLENQRLNRSIDRLALDLAEAEFRPRVTVGAYSLRNETKVANKSAVVNETGGLSSAVRLRIPTGGEFSVSSRFADLGGGSGLASHSGIMELTFVQPLLRGAGFGTARAALRTARINEEINVLSFEAAVVSLMSSALRTFRAYVQAERRDEIAARSLQRGRELLEINQLLVQAGRMAARDVIQTEADIARRELDVISAAGGLDNARLSLIDVLDIDARTRFRVAEGLGTDQPEPLSVNVETAMEMALANRPDHQIGLLGIRNAETRLIVARNSRLWDLSLSLGRTLSASGNDFAGVFGGFERVGGRIGLDLNVPIGQAAAGPARLTQRRAEARLQIARNGLDDLRQRIEVEVRNAVREVELAAQRLELARRARSLAEQKMEIEREKLNLGVTTNFQLVAFENDLVSAENAELNAFVSHLNAATELDRSLGTTLERWGIDLDLVERSNEDSERFGIDTAGAP